MFREIWKDVQTQIRLGTVWTRVIVLCVIVFVVINILKSYFTFTNDGIPSEVYRNILEKVSLSGILMNNLIFPWVWITHIFVHEGFFHLLWNMIFLYWVSQIVDDLIGKNHSIYIFFEGAIIGGIFFMVSTLILPWYDSSAIAYGASAAVTALLFAAATIAPDYSIRFLLIGNVSLKYVALVVLLLDLLFAYQNSNSGGHFAHLGGAFMGWLYIVLLRQGVKMNFLEGVKLSASSRQSKNVKGKIRNLPPREISQDKRKILEEYELDKILEKIKKSGLQSLTSAERAFLDSKSK